MQKCVGVGKTKPSVGHQLYPLDLVESSRKGEIRQGRSGQP